MDRQWEAELRAIDLQRILWAPLAVCLVTAWLSGHSKWEDQPIWSQILLMPSSAFGSFHPNMLGRYSFVVMQLASALNASRNSHPQGDPPLGKRESL
jgi:hypothetical protein